MAIQVASMFRHLTKLRIRNESLWTKNFDNETGTYFIFSVQNLHIWNVIHLTRVPTNFSSSIDLYKTG